MRDDEVNPNLKQERVDCLREQLYAPDSCDRAKAARDLAELGSQAQAALSDLQTRVKDPSTVVRDAALAAIRRIQQQAAPRIRPRWRERTGADERKLTVPEFILMHYKDEIKTRTLTAALVCACDPELYAALLNWGQPNELPDELRNMLWSGQKGELFTLRPGIWGVSIDLKELARRARNYWRRCRN